MSPQKKVILVSIAVGSGVILGSGLLWMYRASAGNGPSEPRPPQIRTSGAAGEAGKGGAPAPGPRPPGEGPDGAFRPGREPKKVSPNEPLTPTPDILALQKRAMDPSLSENERLDIVQKLRHFGKVGLSPEVLASMSQLIANSSEERTRSELCRLLRGGNSPEFCQQLMATARVDSSPRVRSEAVRSLAPLVADPVVKQTLQSALEIEKDSLVRHQIQLALNVRH